MRKARGEGKEGQRSSRTRSMSIRNLADEVDVLPAFFVSLVFLRVSRRSL